MEKDPKDRTLKEALEHAYRTRWAGTRGEKCLMSQAEKAARAVGLEAGFPDARWPRVKVASILPDHLRRATMDWYSQGLSPATINKRLNCLSVMGIKVEGCRVKNPKKLQWWLRPEDEKKVVEWLWHPLGGGTHVGPKCYILGDFILWTTRTGLRVEESLRLTTKDFGDKEVTVPGLKTATSQATLAVSTEANYARCRAFERSRDIEGPSGAIFAFTYEELHAAWEVVRKHFGWQADPTATLKALRRSAARYLHYDCGMPLDMVRQYLRHENIETTMGYLRLTGGVGLDEQRRYLK